MLAAGMVARIWAESCCFDVLEGLGKSTTWLALLGDTYVDSDLLAFPLDILGPLFPVNPDPNAPAISMGLFLAAVLVDVLVYSLLTYGCLSLYAMRRRWR
jgi:hypothetical protein